MKPFLPLLLAASIAVAACGKQDAEDTGVTSPVTDTAVPSKATVEKAVAYVCQRDMPITAIYGTDADGRRDASIIIQGDYFPFVESPTPAAAGARFISHEGVSPGHGLVWWTKDGEATIAEAPLDKLDDLSAAVVKRTCKEKS